MLLDKSENALFIFIPRIEATYLYYLQLMKNALCHSACASNSFVTLKRKEDSWYITDSSGDHVFDAFKNDEPGILSGGMVLDSFLSTETDVVDKESIEN